MADTLFYVLLTYGTYLLKKTAFPIEYDTRVDQNEYEQLPKLCTVQDIRTITSAYIL